MPLAHTQSLSLALVSLNPPSFDRRQPMGSRHHFLSFFLTSCPRHANQVNEFRDIDVI